MRSQRTKGTEPEMALRRALFANGYRYRVQYRIPGMARRTIDIAFPRRKVAVFVDGCFWHGCPDHCVPPRNNAEWWARKLETNRERDAQTRQHLEASGWIVIRLWEHTTVDDMYTLVSAAVTDREDGS